ncbi:STE24 endopeptidase [Actinacidiphila alni]|uniref:STE24 endopeptidase n=1 Tax=Actinacidiphila alni TaxID=380248 RepID=A0A1I2EVT1_9ACTN|nr:M48 family metallopeptidase [Actinacidiphila alni]SFE96899.1 STE24 endopeptidase [Actinacidiphila alni]
MTPPPDRVPADVPGDVSGGPGDDFSAEYVARARELRRGVWPVAVGGRAAGLGLVLALGLTGGGAGLVAGFGGAWAARVAGAAVTLVLLPEALGLPFGARGRVVRRRFGLITQGWGGWWADVLRGLLISLPLTAGALFAVYALAGVTGHWWVWAALGAAAVTVLLSWAAPLVFEPLFNRFTPMAPGPLRDALLALAERDGVTVEDVLVADASRRTTALNAYVSGFGRTRRIVVYDTLLSTADPREVELVVAHELGHVVHRDVPRGTALGALGAAAGVCVLAAVVTWRPLLDLAGADGFADPRSAWLLAAVASVGGAVAAPLGAAVSRRVERRADRHALELTADPAGFIAMQRRLTVVNVGEPSPPRALHLLFGTHPAPAERIAAARAWRVPG